jgi:predicted ATPase
MKVLVGAHGTGKSTLLQEVLNHNPDYFVTDGFSRPVHRLNKKLDLSNYESQMMINELSAWAYQNYLRHSKVISTRGLIDCLIYSEILTPQLDITDLKDLFQSTKYDVEYYFYVPIEFEYPTDDSERSLSETLQVKIDHYIQDFLYSNLPEDKVVRITGSVEERYRQIKKYL